MDNKIRQMREDRKIGGRREEERRKRRKGKLVVAETLNRTW
jgi:ribosomal protein S8E